MNALVVFLVALVTALATGLGVLPVWNVRMDEHRSIAFSSALAAGFMLGASVGLLVEGIQGEPLGTLLGVGIGVAFIAVSSALVSQKREAHVGNLRGARGLTALMVIGVMTIHSFTEGVAIGVSLAGERSLGLLIAIAIAVHNIPEGVAISLTLVPFGEKPRTAAAWSIFSSLPQPLMAVPAFLAVGAFERLLPIGLGFAAGAMGWMVWAQLVPEVTAARPRTPVLLTMVGSAALMIGFEFVLGL